VSLQSELDTLAKKISSFKKPLAADNKTWKEFTDNSVVALMAGGESSRYAAVVGGKKIQKNAHQLPNGDTMIEMAIRTYRDAGIKKFVALVFHNAHTVEDRLGDGSKLGVEIVYSHDPEQPVGKGGAVRNAIENGSIPLNSNLIVVNPDDVILNFPGDFARYICEAHLEGQNKGMLATAVMAPGQPYPGTGMMIIDNQVKDTEMYPFIPVPIHAGITIFSPAILPRFLQLFDYEKKSDFESVLFSILADEGKLWSVGLTEGTWIAVNDLKSYNSLTKMLEQLEKTKER
jgi:NDP-sugar pyrophosphorylase family protein